MKYGDRLRFTREIAGLSQEELANKTNGAVKQGTISKIERGDQERSSFDIDLAIALNVHPKWLKDEDERFAPEWFKYGSNNTNIKPAHHQANSLSEKENEAVSLMKKMAGFQQDEWLDIGRRMAAEADRFRSALTPKFENGVD